MSRRTFRLLPQTPWSFGLEVSVTTLPRVPAVALHLAVVDGRDEIASAGMWLALVWGDAFSATTWRVGR